MRIPRIYHPAPLTVGEDLMLTEEASHHVGRVLRMQIGEPLILFDGSNHLFNAQIIAIQKKTVTVHISECQFVDNESPLIIQLGQVISRGDKMEFTIQKSVELGVDLITPLISERCGVKLDTERLLRKQQQWQKIAIAACEQCGRNRVPVIATVQHLTTWCAEPYQGLKLNLHPRAKHSINTLPASVQNIRLLIGPEGGLSPDEIAMVGTHDFTDILLGPRILRTETAALTAISALQTRFGDLG